MSSSKKIDLWRHFPAGFYLSEAPFPPRFLSRVVSHFVGSESCQMRSVNPCRIWSPIEPHILPLTHCLCIYPAYLFTEGSGGKSWTREKVWGTSSHLSNRALRLKVDVPGRHIFFPSSQQPHSTLLKFWFCCFSTHCLTSDEIDHLKRANFFSGKIVTKMFILSSFFPFTILLFFSCFPFHFLLLPPSPLISPSP
jgi:hypothetical protein